MGDWIACELCGTPYFGGSSREAAAQCCPKLKSEMAEYVERFVAEKLARYQEIARRRKAEGGIR